MTDAPLDPKDIATAGEYVLGTLPREERDAFHLRILREPQLAREVARWESHFDPLADEVTPIAPRPAVWSGIERRLFEPAQPQRAVAGRWMWLALATSFATLALAFMLFNGPVTETPETRDMWVSDMVSEDESVRLTALYNEENGEMRVSMAGTPPAEGRDFELWLIQGDQAPISLGVMPHGGQAAMPINEELQPMMVNATLAITDEPAGGAPGGVATGPLVAQAAMRQI
ncbi:anti-sigma factor domain-containing protein [Paracoccaceae bacterium GXU_MW_L88]